MNSHEGVEESSSANGVVPSVNDVLLSPVTRRSLSVGHGFVSKMSRAVQLEAESDTDPVISSFGGFTHEGPLHANEDRYCVSFHDEFSFFMVADGHDGAQAAMFAEKHLNWNTLRSLNVEDGKGASDDDSETTLDFALHLGVLKTDAQFCQRARQTSCTAGACVLACALRGRHLAMASAGDCAVMYHDEKGVSKLMCKRHSATDPEEAARVIAAGGFIQADRVMGILSPSRGIGDTDVRDQCPDSIIPIPDVQSKIIPRISDTSLEPVFIVLASDGVFDSISLDVTAQIVKRTLMAHRQKPNRAEIASRTLVRNCANNTTDDVTAIVVCFGP